MQTLHIVSIDKGTVEDVAHVVQEVIATTPSKSDADLIYVGRLAAARLKLLNKAFSMVQPPNVDATKFVGLEKLIEGGDTLSKALLSTIVALNDCVPYQLAEQSSDIFQSVAPRLNAPLNSNASAEDFLAHSDDSAALSFARTKGIALLGIENIAEAPTGIVFADDIWRDSTTAFRKALASAYYLKRTPASFGLEPVWRGPVPIMQLHEDGVRISVPTYAVKTDPNAPSVAESALQWLMDYCSDHMQWTVIQRGELLMFRNDRVLHARKKIEGGARRMIRSYMTSNEDIQKMRSLNTETAEFSHLFNVRGMLVPEVTPSLALAA